MGGFPLAWLQPRFVLGVYAVLLAAGFVHLALDARTLPPAVLALETRRTLDRAVELGGRERVPELFEDAESALRAARVERALQESRWLPFRDFDEARSRFERAADAARRVEEAAADTHVDFVASVGARLASMEATLEQVTELTRGMQIESESRLLRIARLRLSEARLRSDAGRYSASNRLIRQASTQVREAVDGFGMRAARYADKRRVREWREWRKSTIDWSRRHNAVAIVVNKEKNRLTVYADGKPERTFRADIGRSFDAKLRDGDRATPEGRYRVTQKKDRGTSRYYKALLLDYPNPEDRRRHAEAVRDGRVSGGVGAGDLIEIHGHGGRGDDWTEGCVALADGDLDHVFDAVRVGTPVTIIGGEGGDGRFSSLASRVNAVRGNIDASAEN